MPASGCAPPGARAAGGAQRTRRKPVGGAAAEYARGRAAPGRATTAEVPAAHPVAAVAVLSPPLLGPLLPGEPRVRAIGHGAAQRARPSHGRACARGEAGGRLNHDSVPAPRLRRRAPGARPRRADARDLAHLRGLRQAGQACGAVWCAYSWSAAASCNLRPTAAGPCCAARGPCGAPVLQATVLTWCRGAPPFACRRSCAPVPAANQPAALAAAASAVAAAASAGAAAQVCGAASARARGATPRFAACQLTRRHFCCCCPCGVSPTQPLTEVRSAGSHAAGAAQPPDAPPPRRAARRRLIPHRYRRRARLRHPRRRCVALLPRQRRPC